MLRLPDVQKKLCENKTLWINSSLASISIGSPCPFYSSTCSFAGENLCLFAASVALYEAAPLEFAIALPHARVLVGVVAPTAAHEVAAVRVRWRVVTKPSPCACASRCSIFLAIVGGTLQVHQVRVCGLDEPTRLFEPQERGLPESRGSHGLHLNSGGIAFF